MASGYPHAVGYTSPPDQATVGLDSEVQEEASERDRLRRRSQASPNKDSRPLSFFFPGLGIARGVARGVMRRIRTAVRREMVSGTVRVI
jgi:hypothetical protein